MSDSLGFALAVSIAEILPAAIGLYAAYWAFSIRRSLVGHIYRSHALWLGAVCVLFAATNFLTYSTNVAVSDALNVYYAILIAALFAFIDSTVLVARRSDPLLRRILGWDRLRIAIWIDIVALVVIFNLPVIDPSFVASINPVVGAILITALFTLPFIAGAPALLIGARRSMDPVLRGSLKWLGVAFLLLVVVGSAVGALVTSLLPGLSQFDQYYSYPAIPGGIFTLISAYAFYRSSRSLAPINRLQAIEPTTNPPAGASMR
jgi:hypothetical protein